MIQSTDNARIKTIKKLKQKKYRLEYNSFIIEGEKIVQEALQRNHFPGFYQVEEVYISESFEMGRIPDSLLASIPVIPVSDKVFSHISEVQSPTGCLAIIKRKPFTWEDIQIQEKKGSMRASLVLLLDEVQDPGNLGTIIRIADAVNAKAVVLGSGCADPFNDKVIRSAMGSLFHIPVIENNLEQMIGVLKNDGYHVVAADLIGTPYYQWQHHNRTALVLGNEGRGLSELVKGTVDSFVSIPMPGHAESLNVSVATGIIAFHMIHRQSL